MRLMFTLAAALLSSALSGCVHFRGMPSLGMKLPERFQHQPPTAETPAKLEKEWWKRTNDQTLLATIRALEVHNLSLEQARFRLRAARFESREYDFLPSLTAATDAQFDTLLEGDNAVGNSAGVQSGGENATGYYSAKLDASWEVPIYGQLGVTADISSADIAFAEADVDAVRTSAICEAVRLYSEMRSKQQEVLKRETIVTAHHAIVKYQSIKHRAGLIVDSEFGMSRQSLLVAQDELSRARTEKLARMQQLAGLLGAVAPDDAWRVPAQIPSFHLPSFQDAPLDVLRNRPDIRKAEASVLAAAGELELSKSELYPKLTLLGNLSQLGNITGGPLTGSTVQVTGIPSISLPLFDWGKRLSVAQSRDERLSEKASIYRETVIAAMNEVEEFWSSYRAAQDREQSAIENAQIATEANIHASLLFKQGINDGIAAFTATIDAANAAITELQARTDTITKLAALTKALGGTSTPTTSKRHVD